MEEISKHQALKQKQAKIDKKREMDELERQRDQEMARQAYFQQQKKEIEEFRQFKE